MTTGLKIVCPRCGVIEVETADCVLIPERNGGRLRMACPLCDMLLDKHVLDEVMALVVTSEAFIVIPDDVSEIEGGANTDQT